MCAVEIPMSGSRSQASITASRFISGSPMPMKTAWSTAVDAAEVQRLIEDLRGGQVAAERHPAGRAEVAGQRAAGLARQADRAAAVAVAHQHGLERPAVGGLEERLAGPVAGADLALELERRERQLLLQRLAAAPPAGSSSPRRSGRRRATTPRPAGRGRRARRARRAGCRGASGPHGECGSRRQAPASGGARCSQRSRAADVPEAEPLVDRGARPCSPAASRCACRAPRPR